MRWGERNLLAYLFCAGEVFQPQRQGLREKRACWDVASCGSQHYNSCSNVTIPISMTKSLEFSFSNTSCRCTKKLRWVRLLQLFPRTSPLRPASQLFSRTSLLTDTSVAAVPKDLLTQTSVAAVPKDLVTQTSVATISKQKQRWENFAETLWTAYGLS